MPIRPEVIEYLDERVRRIEMGGEEKLYLVGPIQLPVQLDEQVVKFNWFTWLTGSDLPDTTEELLQMLPQMNLFEKQQSSVLVYGDFANNQDAVIRFHSICHTGDIFGSKRCDCGFQLKQSMRHVVKSECGAVFYLANHEGRGIGLFSKAMTYLLQEGGLDTVEANQALGFADDARSYEEALVILKHLRKKPVCLLSNNPKKLKALQRAGLDQTVTVSLWGDINPYNRNYLRTKIIKSGHKMTDAQKSKLLQIRSGSKQVRGISRSHKNDIVLQAVVQQQDEKGLRI